jgi:pimeloyl-ACP methyl ester carboxylesterase
MHFVPSTDGVNVAVHDLGGPTSAAVPVLLMVHANGFHARVFEPMVAAGLAERFRCVGPDVRGHGDTEVPDGLTYEWHGFGEDVAAVVAALPDDVPLYGVGHSLGGAALLMAELAKPGSFTALFLYEPITPPTGIISHEPGTPNPMAAGAERRREVFDSWDTAIANFSSKPPLNVFTRDAMRAYVTGGFALQPDGTVRIKCQGATEAAIYRSADAHHVFDRLGEVEPPVTVGVGRIAEFGPGAFAPLVAERLPHGRLERFDDLDHFGPMQAPDRLAASALAAFS